MEMIHTQISEAVQQVLDGHANPLHVYAELKQLVKHAGTCLSEIELEAMIEADKFGGKTFEDNGFKFTKTDGRAMYNFKHIAAWSEIDERKKEIEKTAKLAAQNAKLNMVDDDGEIIEPAQITYTKPSLSVSISKG
jgi:hypothetical protein